MKNIKAGIVGGAGYTGGELIRLLIHHPQVEIVFVNSKSNAGKLIHDVHRDLIGDTGLKFSAVLSDNVDVLFLCLGHGEASKFLIENNIDDRICIIDLSQDFRIKNSELKKQFVYGLPEWNKTEILKAKNIANPGCFATCIQLALLPLANKQLLAADVHINASTGSTGAGQSLTETSHFSWRNNNMSAYKSFSHQHLNEIGQSILQLQQNFRKDLNFIPTRGNFSRGIFTTLYTHSELTLEQAIVIYEEAYAGSPFVFISKQNIDLKLVVNTNKCLIYLEKHGSRLMVTSIIDNLLKGASGQAVQNMNLVFGIDETIGLKLKATAF